MNHPEPTQVVESLGWIMDQLEELRKEREARRLNAGEAAEAMGYNQAYFRGKPWRVPDFGRNGNRHPLSAWRAWHDRPEAERRAEWDALSLAERRRIRGVYGEGAA